MMIMGYAITNTNAISPQEWGIHPLEWWRTF